MSESPAESGSPSKTSKPVGFGTIRDMKWKVTTSGSYPAGLPMTNSLRNLFYEEEMRKKEEEKAEALRKEAEARAAAEAAERKRLQDIEDERKRAEAAARPTYTKALSELEGEEKVAMAKLLSKIGKCEAGFDWKLQPNGSYICGGGGHTVTKEQITAAWQAENAG